MYLSRKSLIITFFNEKELQQELTILVLQIGQLISTINWNQGRFLDCVQDKVKSNETKAYAYS